MVSGAGLLPASYRHCRTISRRHGTTYFWAAQLLPRDRRHHVHALYAFARTADDIVDVPRAFADRSAALDEFARRFFRDLAAGASDDPVLAAVVDTALRFDLDEELFRRFLRSMEMDLTVHRFESWDDLVGYMDGSAAVIGEMMLPILDPLDHAAALEPARDLGFAFQFTNILRDVGADLDLGRQYLPQDDLRRFDVDLTQRRVTPGFRRLMRFEVLRCRELYSSAERGLDALGGRSRRCIRVAHDLYGRILDEIERQQYDVFARRARVGLPTKLAVAGRGLIR